LDALPEDLLTPTRYSAEDMMIIAASRLLKEKVLTDKYSLLLSGIGTAGLASWIAYYQLKKAGIDVELMLGSTLYGWAPRPGDPRVTSFMSLRTCKMITDILHTYGVFAHNRCLSVLGAAQIDRYGNMNSTKLSEDKYLVGSGGANDGVSAAEETFVIMAQSRRRFVGELPYVTCPGDKVKTVVSDKGIFEKVDGDELVLTGYFANNSETGQDDVVKEIREDCGWEAKVHSALRQIEPPRDDEIALLRLLSSKAEG
jgi:hypothetical protein